MTANRKMALRTCALCAAITLGAACGSSDSTAADPTGAAGFGATVASFGDWNGALADTTTPPPVTLPQSVITADNGDNWVCHNTQQEEKRNLDALLVPGTTAGVLWPGALIQGATLIDGYPAEIPLPRSPITISIDLGVENASRRIDDPNSASVQAAIAQLQRAADSRLGSIDPVPARIDFEQTEAFASDQFILDFGGSVQASAPLKILKIPLPGNASVGVNDSLGVRVSWQRHTIAVKLLQPMYTISFADEQKQGPGDYLAPSVTDAQVQDIEGRGMLGPTNLPTYVKSVTYGRMVVFTLTNTSSAATEELEGAVQASLNLFKLGVSGSGSSKLSTRDSLLLQNSSLQVVAFGGSQDSALAAIRTGDLGKFFTSVPATQAVPLGYRVNYLKNGRVALLGVGTSYTRADCTPVPGSQGKYWHFKLLSLTSNGGCDSANYFRQAIVTAIGSSNFAVYPLLDVRGGAMADTTVDREVVLLMPGGNFNDLVVTTNFFPGKTMGACDQTNPTQSGQCILEKDFLAKDQFAVNPYVFTHIITLPGVNDACTVTFTYQVRTEPALAPPASGPTGIGTSVRTGQSRT